MLEGPDFRYSYVNDRLAGLNGLKPEDHLGGLPEPWQTLCRDVPGGAFFFGTCVSLLVIVLAAYAVAMPVFESERDPVLPVHADAVGPAPVTLQRLQPVARRHPQVADDVGGIDVL